jgi:predicted GNAT family acetyltransferase
MARGTLWGAFDGAEPVGLAALLTDGREARLQAVATVPAWRGRGVASANVGAAVAAWQEDHAGVVYVVAEPGSAAERLYQRLGFRGVTREWVLSRRRTSAC